MAQKLIGTMSLPLTERGDVEAEIKDSNEAGAKVKRIFLVYLDGDGWKANPLTPYRVVGNWKPRNAESFPIYDLEQWYEPYWDRLRTVLIWLKANGQTPWFSFEDRCSEIEEDDRKFNMMYYSNEQQFPFWRSPDLYADGVHPKYPGGQNALALNVYRERVEKRVHDLCLELGIDGVYAEPKNEYGYDIIYDENGNTAYSVEDMVTWFRLRCNNLKSLGYTVIGSIRPDMTVPLAAPFIEILDQHRIIEVTDIDKYSDPDFPVEKTIWNTDGAWNGDGPGYSCFGIRNMSEAQAKALGEEAVKRNAYGVIYLSQSRITDPYLPWDADGADNRPTKALADAMGQPPIVYVDVQVCSVTDLLPNPYCPVTTRKFEQGKEPTAVCAIHTAPVPPVKPCWYFLITGNIKHWLRCILFGKH